MITQYVTGNVVTILQRAIETGTKTVVGHGCNCHDAMHSGVAWEMQRAFPIVREMDTKYFESTPNNSDMLGTVLPIYLSGSTFVLNMYTQYFPGADCRYDAIEKAFAQSNDVIPKNGFKSLIIPRIGAGVAGGDWDKIAEIINRVTPDLSITVVDWDGTVFDDKK